MRTLTGIQKILLAVVAVALLGGGYFFYSSRAATEIALTLTTNPDLERGLVGHWTFDGPDVDWSASPPRVRDRAGTDNFGTTTSSMSATYSPVPGVLGQAFALNGVAQYVEIANDSELQFGTGDFTFSGWAMRTGPCQTSGSKIVEKKQAGTGTDIGIHCRPSNGALSWEVRDSNMVAEGIVATVSFEEDVWQHYSGVKLGNSLYLYINGTLSTSSSASFTGLFNTGNTRIGYSADGGARLFEGYVDDIRIYNRALSAEEIKRLYQLGATTKIAETITTNPDLERGLVGHWTFDGPDVDWDGDEIFVLDRSPNGYIGHTWGLFQDSLVPGVLGQAMRFVENGDRIAVTETVMTAPPFTASAWFKIDPDQRVDDINVIFEQRDNDNTPESRSWRLSWTRSTGKVGFRVTHSAGGSTTITGNNSLPVNTWYHVLITFESNYQMRMYIDGVLQTDVQTATDMSNAVGPFNIGIADATSFVIDGSIDDARVYNRILSTEEVKRLYELGATTKIAETITTNPDLERGLVGHWTFDGPDVDWSSTTAEVRDRSGQGNHGNATSGMISATALGRIGQGFQFNGTSHVIVVPDANSLDFGTSVPFTFAAWVTDTKPGVNERTLVFDGQQEGGVGDASWQVYMAASNTVGALITSDTWNNYCAIEGTSTVFATGDWYHVGVVFNRNASCTTNDIVLYVNGVVEPRKVRFTGINTNTNVSNNDPLSIGAFYNLGVSEPSWGGKIDEVRLYNRTLSASDILRLYQQGK